MTLGALLEQTTGRSPEAVALITESARVSYDQLNRTSAALAGWFLDRGLRPGNRIAILWQNSIETVNLLFACFKAGLIAVPINVRLKAPEVAYALDHSGASICFAQPELAGIAKAAAGGMNIAVETRLPDTAFTNSVKLPERSADDIAVIMYTSGTTARPKGVTHTHASLRHGTKLMLDMIGDSGPVCMATTQMCHISGIVCLLLPSILDGKATVLLPAFDAARALDLIERHRVTYGGALPAMVAMMIEEQSARPRDIRSLKAFISGGDSVPVTLQERFASLAGIPILELIGMTESVPTSWNNAHDLRPGSLGKPRSGVEVKIVDLYGRDADAGEMAVRSPANFLGYWRDPEATAAVLRDGWLYTGDLVRRDADGYLWFNGRLKQIIIRGGSNIAPQEVEEALVQHPAVLEAGVIGMPDPLYGQKVAAFLALREGWSASAEELRAFARERLADYKTPEDIWFLPELPKGLTGKVDRRALKELALSESGAPLQILEARV